MWKPIGDLVRYVLAAGIIYPWKTDNQGQHSFALGSNGFCTLLATREKFVSPALDVKRNCAQMANNELAFISEKYAWSPNGTGTRGQLLVL